MMDSNNKESEMATTFASPTASADNTDELWQVVDEHLLDEARQPQLRWEFSEGWISKYEGPALNSTANEAAMESVEIAVEAVRLI